MADIGVLQLTIKDNSEAAGKGLDLLGDALVRVKHAVVGGLGLSSVTSEVTRLAKVINGTKGASTIVRNLGTMFNAINKFSQLKSFSIDAEKLRDTALAMNKVAEAKERMDEVSKASVGSGDWRSMMGGIASESAETVKVVKKSVETIEDQMNHAKKLARGSGDLWSTFMRLGTFTTSKPTGISEDYEHITNAVNNLNIELVETGNIVQSAVVPAFQEMYRIWSMMSYEFNMFKMEASRLTSGDNPLLLGDGKTPGQLLLGDGSEPETFLSTWVRAGEEFKTNWVYFASDAAAEWRAMWSPDWILGGWKTPQSMSTFHIGSGEAPMLLGDGGVSPESMLSTYIDYSEQWKTDWIEAEGTVSDVAEATERVVAATNDATDAEHRYEEGFMSVLHAKQKEAELAEQIRERQEAAFYAEKPTISLDQTNQMADNLTQLDLLKSQLQDAEVKYNQFVNELGAGATKSIKAGLEVQRLRDAIWEYNQALRDASGAQEEVEGTASGLSGAFSSLRGAIGRMFPTITGLVKRFKSMATMRAMRYVIRQVTAGFKEGVENVYHYSKAVGTSLAPAMDSAATALQQMKNSIGAALSPVIQALVPVLQTVVNWFITLINYANQFFALINGQSTWTRALPEQAEAFEKTAKSAKSASKATKDLLADWDELNIIQSQTGGGSGSGSGKTAQEYKNMFEEVSEFDQKVKEALAFIEDHLGGLSGLLKKAGIALLGWKFSKGFTGFLGTLGRLVAGGAIISVGLDLTFGAAYDAGSKGYFDSSDIIRSIVGALATALGGSLIATSVGIPGVLGFGIGLMVAAVISIVGYCQGENDLSDRQKWGNLSMTQDQIEKFVKEQFTFPVDAEVDVMNAHMKDDEEARRKVDEAVSKFNESLKNAQQVVADIDSSTAQQKVEAVKQAAIDAQEAIKAMNELISTNETGLTYTLTNFTFRDKEGNDITNDLLNSIKVSDTTLQEYFNGMGEDLAALMLEGEKSGWKNGEMEAALELMASQKRIYDRAAEMQNKMKFEIDTTTAAESTKNAANNGLLDRETAVKIYEEQKKRLSEYEETVKATVKKEADNLSYLAALAESAAIEAGYDPATGLGSEVAQKLHAASIEYQDAATKILVDVQGTVDERLKETKEKMAVAWADTLRTVYGGDFEQIAKDLGDQGVFNVDAMDALLDPFGDDYSWNSINKHGVAETANRLYELLIGEMTAWNSDYNGLVRYYVSGLGGNLFDLMTEEARKAIASKLLTYSDNSGNAFQIFKAMFQLDDETAKKYIDPMYQNIWENIDKEEPIKPDVGVEPVLQVDGEDVYEQMKKEVEEALSDRQLTLDEQMDLMVKYSEMGLGLNALDDILKELNYVLDEEGYSVGMTRLQRMMAEKNGLGYIGNTGVSDTPYSPGKIGSDMGEDDFSMDVEAGTRRGNDDQNSLIRQISTDRDNVIRRASDENNALLNTAISLLRAIANKNFTVNVTPSSSLGMVNRASSSKVGKITGNSYML